MNLRRVSFVSVVSVLALGAFACSEDLAAGAGDVDAGSNAPGVDSGPGRPTHDPADAAVTVDATPPRTRVPAFVAHGALGRTLLSCDDGKTWVADRSDLPDARCFDNDVPEPVDCDHHRFAATGLVAAGDFFVASYGHGYAGPIRRSQDGIEWETVLEGRWFGGLAYGQDTVIALDRGPAISTAFGAKDSWENREGIDLPGGAVRGGTWSPAGDGAFLLMADGNMILRSTDRGTTWTNHETPPEGCARNGFVHGNDITLNVSGDGTLCRTGDGGITWTRAKVADSFGSNAIFTSGQFQVWSGSTRWSSADGVEWQSQAGSGNPNVGAVARAESGTYVSVLGGWQVWYERQQFFRSVDGLVWEPLAEGTFSKGHPIRSIVAGSVKPSALCPL